MILKFCPKESGWGCQTIADSARSSELLGFTVFRLGDEKFSIEKENFDKKKKRKEKKTNNRKPKYSSYKLC